MPTQKLDYTSDGTQRRSGATSVVMGQLGLGFGCLLMTFGLVLGIAAATGLADEPGMPGTWRDGVRLGGPIVAVGVVLYAVGARSYRSGRQRERARSS